MGFYTRQGVRQRPYCNVKNNNHPALCVFLQCNVIDELLNADVTSNKVMSYCHTLKVKGFLTPNSLNYFNELAFKNKIKTIFGFINEFVI